MDFTEEEIEEIKEMEIKNEDWNTAQYPYMTNKQIIKVHQFIYDTLIKQVKQLRGGASLGDFGVPILVNKLLFETEKRFKKG